MARTEPDRDTAASRTRAARSRAGAGRPARCHARRSGPGVESSRGSGGDLGDRGGPRTDRPPTGDPPTSVDSRGRPGLVGNDRPSGPRTVHSGRPGSRAEDEHPANRLCAAGRRLSGILTRCGPGWTVSGLADPEHGPSPPAPVGAGAEQGRPRPRCPPDAGLGRLPLPSDRQGHVDPTGRAEPRLTRTASAQTPSTSAGLPR